MPSLCVADFQRSGTGSKIFWWSVRLLLTPRSPFSPNIRKLGFTSVQSPSHSFPVTLFCEVKVVIQRLDWKRKTVNDKWLKCARVNALCKDLGNYNYFTGLSKIHWNTNTYQHKGFVCTTLYTNSAHAFLPLPDLWIKSASLAWVLVGLPCSPFWIKGQYLQREERVDLTFTRGKGGYTFGKELKPGF